MALKPVYEGTLNAFYKYDTQAVAAVEAGVCVKLDTDSGEVTKVTADTDVVFGLLAQKVDPNKKEWILDSVNYIVKPGEAVGVYTGEGHYITTEVVAGVTKGSLLYADANGKLTNVKPAGAKSALAIAETDKDALTQTAAQVETKYTRIFFFGKNV